MREFQISELEINKFHENLINLISVLKEQNRIAEIDVLHIFSYTLMNYSTDRYLNNQTNILKLLEKISTQLLVLKHRVRTKQQAASLFRNIRNQIINQFNEIIKRRKELFNTISTDLIDTIIQETSEVISEFTKNRLQNLRENLELISFINKLIESAEKDESFYKLHINQSEHLKNITFLENSYSNPGDFFFSKEEHIGIQNLNMGTINYLANHILNREYSVNKLQLQITYKLNNSPINKMTNHSLTAKREHIFNFWNVGDELIKLGIGYWYPYFTTKNNSRDNKDINVNFIIPHFNLEILNKIKGNLPKIENFQEKLESFDHTKKSSGNLINYEVTHDQIKDFIAAEPDTLEEGWFLVKKEYKTGSVGDIDVLFKNREDDFLVIEVKKETTGYEPVGQILSYINWIKNNLADENTKVRGIIVCGNIHPQLKSAFNEANNPDLQVWKYEKLQEGFKFEKNLEIKGKKCPFCGNLCSPRALICPGCGDPF